MMVSANIASCTPAEPTTAGPRILKKLPHRRIEARPLEAGADAGAARIGEDEEELGDAGDGDAPGRGMAGARKQERQRRAPRRARR